jgi:predicted acetyltransferase
MNLALAEPSVESSGYFLELVEELKAAGQPLAGTETLDRAGMASYVAGLLQLRAGVGLQSWQVSMSTFWLLDDRSHVVGICRIRHRLTPTLREHGGHIGFLIRPSARGNGYGVKLLALSLLNARDLGIGRVLL